jgi:hypothetical protein
MVLPHQIVIKISAKIADWHPGVCEIFKLFPTNKNLIVSGLLTEGVQHVAMQL